MWSCDFVLHFHSFKDQQSFAFLTAWPADTATDKILPGIGAFTVSAPAGTGAAAAAGAGAGAGAALGAGAAAGAAPFTSLTSTSYAVPFTVTLNFSS